MHCRTTCHHRRADSCGMTLVEVVVVLAIIGVLMAMLLPAVQSSRNVARSVTCRSRLRQVGLALHNYQASNQVFPPSLFGADLGPPSRYDAFSVYARLMPYLDQAAVARRIRWTGDFNQPTTIYDGDIPTLSELRCPSEVGNASRGASFGLSTGTLPGPYPAIDPLPNSVRRLVGAFTLLPATPQQFQDGLSQTIGLSEIRFGSGGPYDPSRDAAQVNVGGVSPNITVQPSFWIGQCQAVTTPVNNWGASHGHAWIDATCLFYGHILPPNSRVIDCQDGTQTGALAARSYHEQTTHSLLMDGNVRGFSNSIALRVWWALGTRAGQDFVEQ